MKVSLSAYHVDTCLPDYLQDSYNRDGEVLLLCVPRGQPASEAAEELYDSMSDACGLPESVSEKEVLAVLTDVCRDIDLRYIDGDGNCCEEEPDGWEDMDTAYVYVVLQWSGGLCPECGGTEFIVTSYQVGNANVALTLAFDKKGRVFDFEFDRAEGEVSDVALICTACDGDVVLEDLLEV